MIHLKQALLQALLCVEEAELRLDLIFFLCFRSEGVPCCFPNLSMVTSSTKPIRVKLPVNQKIEI